MPRWYALKVQGGRERAAIDRLSAIPGVFAFYPSQERKWWVQGRKIARTVAIVSGFVYAKFDAAPMWHVLKSRGIIHGVISRGSWPVEIPPAIIRHLQGMTVEAQALDAARREMMMIRPGDKARLTVGDMQVLVDVESVKNGEAVLSGLLGKWSANVEKLERVQK
jgi:transcription antitermination factor NusG